MNGLSCRFGLVNGALSFTSGKEKATDNLWFFAIFDRFRVYTSDYGGNFPILLQKPVSSLLLSKTIITGQLRTKVQKYVPNVNVDSIDIGYVGNNRKELHMQITYTYIDDSSTLTDVIFI